MEVVIIKRESTGSGSFHKKLYYMQKSAHLFALYNFCPITGSNAYNESENISKYEIMDGAPVRGMSNINQLASYT